MDKKQFNTLMLFFAVIAVAILHYCRYSLTDAGDAIVYKLDRLTGNVTLIHADDELQVVSKK